MIMARGVARAAVVAAMVLMAAGAVQAVVIDTVHVGNPGNAADPETGYGAVAYEYNIGKYEVTAGQYTAFLNAVAATDTYGLYNTDMDSAVNSWACNIKRTGSSGSYTYSVPSDWANRPVNFVSWGDAARFANWLHNGQPTGTQNTGTTEDGSYALNGAMTDVELLAVTRKANATWASPSEDEWYKAAYHKNDGATGNYFDYPTGSDSAPSNDLIGPDPGNNANYTLGSYDVTIGGPYWRTEVGDFENSESPYGTFDQGGNVWEWNEALMGGFRGLRAGSFNWDAMSMQAANSSAYYPTYECGYVGFRVSEVPEPATMALLALGGIGMLMRRRGLAR